MLTEPRAQLPDSPAYFSTVTAARFEQHRPPMTTVPISMRFREYHAVSPTRVVPTGRTQANAVDEGVLNAWLPHKAELFENRGALRVVDQTGSLLSTYERWQDGRPSSHDPGRCMMCVNRRLRLEEESEARREERERRERLAKKRKGTGESDDEDEPMDDSDVEDEDDRESRASAKRPRTGRGPSARREDPRPAEDAQFDASGMEQVEDAEMEELQRQWQQSMGSTSKLDEVLEEEVRSDDKPCDGVQDVLFIGEVRLCFVRGDCSDLKGRYARLFQSTAKHGITTNSTDACVLGTASSPWSAFLATFPSSA